MQKISIAIILAAFAFTTVIQSTFNIPLFAQNTNENEVKIFNALYFNEERASFIFDHQFNDTNPQGQELMTDFRGNTYIYDEDTGVFNGRGYVNHMGVDYSLQYEPMILWG